MVQHADIDHTGITGVGGGGNTLSVTSVYRATAQLVAGSGTDTAVSWSNEVEDDDGVWAIGTPTKFVIPSALNTRRAIITAQVYMADSTTGSYRGVWLYRGGTGGTAVGGFRVPDGSTAFGHVIQVQSKVLTLATADEYELYFRIDGTGIGVEGGATLTWMELRTVD